MRISKVALVLILIALAAPVFGQSVEEEYQKAIKGGNLGWKSSTAPGYEDLGPTGSWWRNQTYVVRLALTTDQQKRMDGVFQQSRLRLIDLTASLDKEEAILEPMLQADVLDELKVSAQIDKVANARAELEKANAKMLLGIRLVLTPEQWTKLNSSKLGGYYDELNKADLKARVKGRSVTPKF
jgi:Spy/CpxP family protein refolding chaperone